MQHFPDVKPGKLSMCVASVSVSCVQHCPLAWKILEFLVLCHSCKPLPFASAVSRFCIIALFHLLIHRVFDFSVHDVSDGKSYTGSVASPGLAAG